MNKKALIIIALIIPLLLSFYLRTYPARLTITKEWAQSTVYKGIENSILQQLDKQYKYLPPEQKQELINQQLLQIKKEYRQEINQRIQELSNYYRDKLTLTYDDNQSTTYLLAIDPYTYYRYTINYLDHGHAGDKEINGTWYDTLMLAPLGIKRDTPFHVYVEAYWFKLVKLFRPRTHLMQAIFYLPIILSILSIIPVFFIGRKISYAPILAAFIAATLIAIHPAFLGRTTGGFADTDAYNVLFPALIALFLLYAITSKNIKLTILYSILAGISQAIYMLAWSAWWYTFDIFMIALAAIIGIEIIHSLIHKKNLSINKKTYLTPAIFLLILLIFAPIFGESLTSVYQAPLNALTAIKSFKAPVKQDLWPNVYTTVAELNPASISNIVSQMGMGSALLFLLSIMGIALLFIDPEKINIKSTLLIITEFFLGTLLIGLRDINPLTWLFLLFITIAIPVIYSLREKQLSLEKIGFGTIIAIWFIASIYTATKGVRFTLLLVVPFSISVAISIAWMYKFLEKNSTTLGFKDTKKVLTIFTVIVLVLFLLPQRIVIGKSFIGESLLDKSAKIAIQEIPSMSDAWYDTLKEINQTTSKDAIITSWWDFGHWFKAIAWRRVTFDGASQNTPQAHWVGKILQTSNEREAIGILRMLDCGANNAFNEINKELNNTLRSKQLLDKIVLMDKEEARMELERNNITNIDKVLSYTHCNPPQAILITSEDMVAKAGVWAHFGLWNFTKAEEVRITKQYNQEKAIEKLRELGLSQDQAIKTFYEIKSLPSQDAINTWVSPWPTYISQEVLNTCEETMKGINCTINRAISRQGQYMIAIRNIYINLTNINNSYIEMATYSQQAVMNTKKEQPARIVILTQNSSIDYKFKDQGIGITTDGQNILLSTPQLSNSLFTKLFFFDGEGTTSFKKIIDKTTFSGQRIKTWEVRWETEK